MIYVLYVIGGAVCLIVLGFTLVVAAEIWASVQKSKGKNPFQ